MAEPRKENHKVSQTLIKAIRILEAFDGEHPQWGVRELARHVNINPTTVHRLASTFLNLGYLEQDPVTRRYSLGPRVMKLAGLYAHHNPLTDIASKVFQKHIQDFTHSFYLIALSGGFEAVYLVVLEGRSSLRVNVEPGSITGLHSTAAGKVLLAYQGEEFVDAFLKSKGLERYTANTITSPKLLKQELVKVRQQGFAINDGEQFEDIGAIAVPVFDQSDHVVCSVSLAFPRHLLKEGRLDQRNLVRLAKKIAHEIMLLRYGAIPSVAQNMNSDRSSQG
jgi:IclR family acetate operon transcriptional repressor